MKIKTHHTQNFIVVFSLTILTAWLILPRAIRRAIVPTAFAAATTFTVNVTGDGQDANPGDGICQTSVVGNCSLRAAIEEANANSGRDTIEFNIPGGGVHTIFPGVALPNITDEVTIDGYSQPGASPNTRTARDNAVLLIELRGINGPANAAGIDIHSDIVTVKGLVINRFGNGIVIADDATSVSINGNFIGTDPTGLVGSPNLLNGIVAKGDFALIGGSDPSLRNIISGNGANPQDHQAGIVDQGFQDSIAGNFIGVDATGAAPFGNTGSGVYCASRDHLFISANIISSNGKYGIELHSDDNIVVGNFIDTNAAGTAAIGNALSGILVDGSSNDIGAPFVGNVISGNFKRGIAIPSSGATENSVEGNRIGTDASGQNPLGNLEGGVLLGGGTQNNIIGGESPGRSNFISGNTGPGVEINGNGTALNKVQGNFIGLAADATTSLGNSQDGVLITSGASVNTIGGDAPLGNVIAFNGDRGVNVIAGDSSQNFITTNSIFSNQRLGIDLGGDGVTPNDTDDADFGPNDLQNFPVITSVVQNGGAVLIGGTLASPGRLRIEFFSNPSCDPSGNGEGHKFISTTTLNSDASGHSSFLVAVPISDLSGPFITATAYSSNFGTSEFSQCVQLSAPLPIIQFGQASYDVFEDCTAVSVSVARQGDTSSAATVDYSTQSGSASEHSDFNTAIGTLTFAPGETAKSFDVLISEDSYSESTESFTIALSNLSGAMLGSPATTTVQILDDPPEPATNPIDTADGFVCQHYHDFLNREDDSVGLAFWTNNITSCGNDAACVQRKRVDTSAAFFLSIEFQETGGFAIRVQRVAFGKKSAEAATRISYTQFIHDARQVGEGVVVGQPGFDIRLAANEETYATQVVNSAAFINKYPLAQTADQYVDALFASAGVIPTNAERQAAINAFGGGGTPGRTAALRSVSDSNSVGVAEFSPTFVLMQYYGYLRRNPTDAPDNNDNGYQFWLTKLNNFGGDFRRAEMVKAFILSGEYRSRFGAP